MDLVREQLLERFEIQCGKRLYNFPFLLGQGVWIDSDKLKPNDRLRKILKHGTLSIGFIGLAECLKALIGKHHGESEEAQKLGLEIVDFMRKRCDEYAKEYHLNFTLLATPAFIKLVDIAADFRKKAIITGKKTIEKHILKIDKKTGDGVGFNLENGEFVEDISTIIQGADEISRGA